MQTRRQGFSSGLLIIVSVLLMFTMTSVRAATEGSNLETASTDANWTTYIDPRFDFSLEYPSAYAVEPRNDEMAGSVLSFRQTDPLSLGETHKDEEVSAQFVVGMYFVEWTGNETIEEWTEKYYGLAGLESSADRNESISYLQVDGIHSVRVTDHNLAYQYVNIPRGGIVWFVWANGAVDPVTFEKVSASLRFGTNSPETLQDIYGTFYQPLSINGNETQQREEPGIMVPIYLRVPLSGYASCNSEYHVGESQYAIDVSKPEGTSVYASQTGSVFYGWYPHTWGNLLIITTEPWAGSYSIYYAHLSGYDEETLHSGPPFFYAYKDERIGWTGNTGQSSGPHLHFEVRDSSGNGVTLVGMFGFTAWGSYPTGDSCGELVR